MNNFNMLTALIFEPRRAFNEIAERPRVLFPMVVIILTTAGLVLWYYSVVDIAWMTDKALRSSPFARQLTEDQIAQQVQGANSGARKWLAVVASVFGVILVRLIEALYYLLAGKVTNVQRSFKQWLSLGSWTSLPQVLAVVPAAITLMTATSSQIDQGALQPLSLNELFFHRTMGESGYMLLSNINLLQLASMFLVVLGVRVWSGRSWLFSALFTLLPALLIGGIVALIALGR